MYERGDKFERLVVSVGPKVRDCYSNEYKLHQSSVIPGLLNSQRKYTRIHLVGVLNIVTRLNRSIYYNEPTQTHVETRFD